MTRLQQIKSWSIFAWEQAPCIFVCSSLSRPSLGFGSCWRWNLDQPSQKASYNCTDDGPTWDMWKRTHWRGEQSQQSGQTELIQETAHVHTVKSSLYVMHAIEIPTSRASIPEFKAWLLCNANDHQTSKIPPSSHFSQQAILCENVSSRSGVFKRVGDKSRHVWNKGLGSTADLWW